MLTPAASRNGVSAVLTALFMTDLMNTVPGKPNIPRPPHGWFCGHGCSRLIWGTLTPPWSDESIHRFRGSPKDRLLH